MIHCYRLFCAIGIAALAACTTSQTPLMPQNAVGTVSSTNDVVVPDATSILQNGSFETPVVPKGSYTTFSKGKSFFHWRVTGNSGNVAVTSRTFVSHGYKFPTPCGNQWLDLTGTSNTKTGVVQRVPTTSGKTYTIAFEVGNTYQSAGSLGTSSIVLVYVDGKKIDTAKNTMGKGLMHIVWEKFSTQFTAQSTTAAIKFLNGDPPSDAVNGLDCVTVTQV
jgi:hypothetical protein